MKKVFYKKFIYLKYLNLEKLDIIICLKKRSKNWKNIKKKRYREAKESKKQNLLTLSYQFFPKSIRILKRPKREIAPPETQIDVRCMQPRFENSPYYAWSIWRDVGQVLHRQSFPCNSYYALLTRGQGPDSAETNPFTFIRDAMKTACVELVKNTS